MTTECKFSNLHSRLNLNRWFFNPFSEGVGIQLQYYIRDSDTRKEIAALTLNNIIQVEASFGFVKVY